MNGICMLREILQYLLTYLFRLLQLTYLIKRNSLL